MNEPLNRTSGVTALMICASHGSLACMQLILDAGADIQAKDRCGQTAMHYACRSQKIENLEFMLQNDNFKPIYETRSNGGVTPLMLAV